MKKYLFSLFAVLALLCVFTPVQAQASVTLVNQTYEQSTGDFTLTVKTTEPWVVWRTFDFMHWERVSPVLGVGHKTWTDSGVGLVHPWAFYVATPKNKHPNNGNHYGWYVDQNPHNPDQE